MTKAQGKCSCPYHQSLDSKHKDNNKGISDVLCFPLLQMLHLEMYETHEGLPGRKYQAVLMLINIFW
jgi:hypothetical protein